MHCQNQPILRDERNINRKLHPDGVNRSARNENQRIGTEVTATGKQKSASAVNRCRCNPDIRAREQ